MNKVYKEVKVDILEYGNMTLITLTKNNDSISKAVDSFKVNDSYIHNLVHLYLQLLKAYKEF